jgi:hypothetical protein
MKRTSSKRRETSWAVGVLGFRRRYKATHTTTAMVKIKSPPPRNLSRLRTNPTSSLHTTNVSARNARTAPWKITSGCPLPDPVIALA